MKSAAWSNDRETDYVGAFEVKLRRATGAGDCCERVSVHYVAVWAQTQ